MKTEVITFANNKGGSGKTTTCSNVAYCLADKGKKVLMIDGDMQMNLSLSFLGEDEVLSLAQSDNNLYTAILSEKDMSDTIIRTPYENLDLVPSSMLMSGIEEELFKKGGREDVFEKVISEVRESGEYDYIVIDTPPTIGLWDRNVLHVTDHVVIPVEASPWGLFGLASMVSFIKEAEKKNPALGILGIVLTRVNVRKNYFRQTEEFLSDMKEIYVFDTVIRNDSMVEWAQDNSKPVTAYRRNARSAEAYRKLTDEILTRL